MRRKSDLTDDEIEGATAFYLKDEGAPPFASESGHRIGVAMAIEMQAHAKKLMLDKAMTPGLRRTMAKTAVIMGLPVQG